MFLEKEREDVRSVAIYFLSHPLAFFRAGVFSIAPQEQDVAAGFHSRKINLLFNKVQNQRIKLLR